MENLLSKALNQNETPELEKDVTVLVWRKTAEEMPIENLRLLVKVENEIAGIAYYKKNKNYFLCAVDYTEIFNVEKWTYLPD